MKINKSNRLIAIFLFLLVIISISGFFYIKYVRNTSIKETSNQAIIVAETAVTSLNDDTLKQLHAVPEDVGTTAYENIKKKLLILPIINKNIRFAYFYTKREGKIYFLVDSEAIDSKDYSPPGQEFSEANDEVKQPFIEGKTLVTKPGTDRWGTWVSILVPIKDTETGEVFAVFGMDYPAHKWQQEALVKIIEAGITIFIVILLLITFFIIMKNNYKKIENEKKYKYLFSYSKDAIMTLYPPDWKFIDGNPATLELFGLKDGDELKTISPGDVSPEYQPDGQLSNKKAKEMINIALEKGHYFFFWTHKKKNGEDFLANVSLTKIEVGRSFFIQAVVRDITDERKIVQLIQESEEKTRKALGESERVNKLMVGRELEMIRLKKEIIELKNKDK